MTCSFFKFLIYGTLIGFSSGLALIGQSVRDARPDEFLFVVSIARRDAEGTKRAQDRHLCTGTLISRKTVLTAGHCLTNKTVTDVEIIAGSADLSLGKTYFPDSWVTYDKWKSGSDVIQQINDVAIITLEDPGVESTKIKPISVLTLPLADLFNSEVRIAGWGDNEDDKPPEVLQTAVLKVMSIEECERKLTCLLRVRFVVNVNYFCSFAKPYVLSSCGDSGAPIINEQDQLVAINMGDCPLLRGFSQDFVNRNRVNSHLNLFNFKDFIANVTK